MSIRQALICTGAGLGLVLLSTPAFAGVNIDTADDRRSSASVVKDDLIVLKSDKPFAEVRVADPKYADVLVLTDRSFHVMGKVSGRTNVMLYDNRSRLIDIIDVKVEHDVQALRETLVEAFPLERISAKSMAGGVYLSGTVSSTSVAERAIKIAQAFAPERVTSGLDVRDSHQVMLEVRFVEATRDVVKSLGIGVLASNGSDLAFQAGAGIIGGAPEFVGNVLGGIEDINLDTRIQALEENGIIRTLAEPNLVSMTGETASFLAGGEYPIPVPADNGQIAIEYRQFGVGLAFTPTVLDRGVINLKVAPEVSQIDTANSVRLQGVDVPGLRVRRANTTVELRNGQSFAIAGLLQNESADSKSQVPWLGDLPIIGSLFRSSRFERAETELVIIVTPRLVRPAPDIADLATPLDTIAKPGEAELFLNGNLEGRQNALLNRN